MLCSRSLRIFRTQNKFSHRKVRKQKPNMKGAEVPTPVHKGSFSTSGPHRARPHGRLLRENAFQAPGGSARNTFLLPFLFHGLHPLPHSHLLGFPPPMPCPLGAEVEGSPAPMSRFKDEVWDFAASRTGDRATTLAAPRWSAELCRRQRLWPKSKSSGETSGKGLAVTQKSWDHSLTRSFFHSFIQ